MTLQRLMSYTRKAVDEYRMIEEGDRIAVGISGGKDSLTLLYALHGLRRFYPKQFDIEAITVDLGHQGLNLSGIEELCHKFEVPYTIVRTDIAEIVFDVRKESNPCSLCAKMRKGATIVNKPMVTVTENYRKKKAPLLPRSFWRSSALKIGCPRGCSI